MWPGKSSAPAPPQRYVIMITAMAMTITIISMKMKMKMSPRRSKVLELFEMDVLYVGYTVE
jgi:hypothetical protein